MLTAVEPVTHMLTGACLSRAFGFPAKARYATAACVIAAELPDADYVYRLGGPLLYFQHHRGWTHAFWSLPLQAAFVVGIFYLVHRTRHRWKRRRSLDEVAEANWPLLFGMCMVALLSHLLLDWTNNYGLRPFAPFSPKWFEGDLVFIVEPLLLLFLGAALALPLLTSLVNREIGVRRTRHGGRGLASAALVLTVLLWMYRAMQHGDGLSAVRNEEYRSGGVLRAGLSPYPIDPYRWQAIVETPTAWETGSFDSRTSVFDVDTRRTIAKPAVTAAVTAAEKSWLGHVYLDWSRYPVVLEAGSVAELHAGEDVAPEDANLRVVQFRDLRFGYPVLGTRAGRAALMAEAWVDSAGTVRRIFFGNDEQKLR